jgi:hypothetical protein
VPLSLSTSYRIFSNPFYAGVIEWNGQIFPGKHEPVVTLQEFERVQMLLGRPGRPRPKHHRFAFTGMMRCGACGLMITAEEKLHSRTGYRYTYYHCTKRGIGPRCSQPYVASRQLQKQIIGYLESIYVPPRVRDVAIRQLREHADANSNQLKTRVLSVERAMEEATKQLSELTGLRLRGLLTDAEYLNKREELQRDKLRLDQQLVEMKNETNRFEPTKALILFNSRAVDWFQRGDREVQRLIFETVGSNHFLKDKILSIEARKPFKLRPPEVNDSNVLRFIDDVRKAFDEDPNFETLIVKNVKRLREYFRREDQQEDRLAA